MRRFFSMMAKVSASVFVVLAVLGTVGIVNADNAVALGGPDCTGCNTVCAAQGMQCDLNGQSGPTCSASCFCDAGLVCNSIF